MDEHLRGIPLRGLSIEELEAKQEALGKYIKAKKAEISREARKREDRRKILVGAYVLKLAAEGSADAKRMLDGIGEYLTRPKDRELFGLDNPQDAPGAPSESLDEEHLWDDDPENPWWDDPFQAFWDLDNRHYLKVPYTPNGPNPEKDEVKRLGAHYDPNRKAWYIVQGEHHPPTFKRWIGKLKAWTSLPGEAHAVQGS